MSEPRPKVSVVMITYNHEKFIEQAVNSVLMQVTGFDYEIIIGEDCSTDRTREILIELQKQHPDKIRLVLNPQNLGMIPNFVNMLNAARGEYIALLDGDDYWTDSYKLAKQVRFLDDNPGYVLVCANAVEFDQDARRVVGLWQKPLVPLDFSTRDLMQHNPCPALTAVFRNGVVDYSCLIRLYSSFADRALYILLSEHGQCRFLPDVVGVYRRHSASATRRWASSYEANKATQIEKIRFVEQWNEYLGNKYDHEVRIMREQFSRSLCFMALRHLDIRTALEFCDAVDLGKLCGWKSKAILIFLRMIRRLVNLSGLRAMGM